MSFMNRMGNGAWKAALALAALGVLCGRANAVNDPIANFTFETSPPGGAGCSSGCPAGTDYPASGPGIAADSGTGFALGHHALAGATWSNPVGNGSNESFSVNQWTVGDYFQFQVSTASLSNIGIQFEQMSSSTGPRDFKVQYSTNGTSFTDLASYSLNSVSWSSVSAVSPPQLDTFSYDLSSITAVNNQANLYFRIADASNFGLGGASTVPLTGTDRVDNVGIYANFNINQSPIVPPVTPPVALQANDVVIGVNNGTPKATLGLARGSAVANGGSAPGTFSGWQSNAFIQYVAFDNKGGTAHNVNGNLLGVDSGSTSAAGGTIYNLATQGSLPYGASQTLATTPNDRLGQIAVSPSNNKIAVAGADSGQITFWDYTAGNSQGASAALANKRTTGGTPLTQAISTTVGTATTITQQRQGVAWLDNNTVLSMSTAGNLFVTDSTNLISVSKGTVVNAGLVSASTSLEYNTAISPYVWALYGGFNGAQNANLGNSVNTLYIIDPTNFSVLHQVDLSSSSTTNGISTPAGSVPTANSLAFDSSGDLFIGGNGGSVSVIPHAASNALTIGDLSASPWYVGTFSSFTGIDIGLPGAAPAGVSGDYNNNGVVDMADYVLWRNGGPLQNDPTPGVQPSDYDYWRSRFGATSGSGSGLGSSSAVPEPASALLMLLGVAAFGCKRRS